MELIEKLRQNKWANYYILFTRFLIGFAFIPSGLTKLFGERFTTIPTSEPIGFFFEGLYQTGLYWQFLGFTQIFAALLLFTQRFATAGALMFFGIITNIFVITLSMNFNLTPVITGLMLLACTTLIVYDWAKIKILFSEKQSEAVRQTPEKLSKNWRIIGLVLFLLINAVMIHGRFSA